MSSRQSFAFVGVFLAALAVPTDAQVPAHPGMLRFEEPRFTPPDPAAHRIELPGGAIGFVAEDRTLPLVDVAVALRVGSFLDPPDKTGLASLTGSLVRRAGAGELSAAEFDDQVAVLGARVNSFTGITRGGASLNVTTPGLDKGLDLFFSMLFEPRFDAERVSSTQRTLFENLRRRNEDPLGILEREWEWLLWGEDHFSTRPVTAAGLDRMAREELVRFHRRYWHPANMVFAVSGDIGREEARELLTRLLSRFEPAAEAVTPPWPPPSPTHEPVAGPYVIEKAVPQAKVRLGHREADAGNRTEAETAAIRVMSEILGGSGAISRINGRLRTAEGLVYRANASYDTGELWSGEFRVFFDTANRTVARAVELTVDEILRMRARPVHPQELKVVKESLLAELRQSFDTAEEVAGYLAEDELLGRSPADWSARYRAIQAVTASDVLAAANRYLRPEDLIVLAVGTGAEIGLDRDDAPSELQKLTGRPIVLLPIREPLNLTKPNDS